MTTKAKCPSPKNLRQKFRGKKDFRERVTEEWGKFHRKRKLRTSTGKTQEK